MKQLFTFLFLAISAVVFSQAPQSIPYQAVVRNIDGSTMANAAVTITFKIHDNSAMGTVVYEETLTTTTNVQGLVSLNVGGGTAVTGSFSGIQWGTGSKFLHVLMNAGSGVVDLGTQQMMSVPYALYAEDVNVRVSVTGDSLFIGDQVSIVPGVSAANPAPLFIQGQGVVDIDGNYYPSIIINGQEWMQKNLAVKRYNNGDSIPQVVNDSLWNTSSIGAYCIFDDTFQPFSVYDFQNDSIVSQFGLLYNWYAAVEERNLCPAGWRVPSLNELKSLISFIDPLSGGGDIWPNEAGRKMRTLGSLEMGTGLWTSNELSTNTSGFSAVPGGYRWNGTYWYLGQMGNWWVTDDGFSPIYAYMGQINAGIPDTFYVSTLEKQTGLSIRCIKN